MILNHHQKSLVISYTWYFPCKHRLQRATGHAPRSHGTLIGALRDRGLSRHADDCEIDVAEQSVEAMQSVRMKATRGPRFGAEGAYSVGGMIFMANIW